MGLQSALKVDVQVLVQQIQKMVVVLVLGCEVGCLVEEEGCRSLIVHAIESAEVLASILPMGLPKLGSEAAQKLEQWEVGPRQAVEVEMS